MLVGILTFYFWEYHLFESSRRREVRCLMSSRCFDVETLGVTLVYSGYFRVALATPNFFAPQPFLFFAVAVHWYL